MEVDLLNPRNLLDLELKGFTVVKDVFSNDEVSQLKNDYEIVKARAYEIMSTTAATPRVFFESNVETRSEYWKTNSELILQAGKGRFDLFLGFNKGSFASEFVTNNKVIGAIVSKVLISDYSSYGGVVLSTAGSSAQYWHRDTDTLSNHDTSGSKLVTVDDFYFTCLIPISVPLTIENGAPEFMVWYGAVFDPTGLDCAHRIIYY